MKEINTSDTLIIITSILITEVHKRAQAGDRLVYIYIYAPEIFLIVFSIFLAQPLQCTSISRITVAGAIVSDDIQRGFNLLNFFEM